ncbi:MAG: hypothetical protein SOT81_02470 [Treponema sp.]|nr:hypothetical protein [Treponema sp.]
MQAVAERTQVIELVKTLPDEQVNYILQVIQSLPKKNSSRKCGLKGCFSSYANPSLREKEKEAWAFAAEEKHGLR